ncbi:MAG: exodeoxyribonuclease V subunit gamma [Solirubrobacteraceae bacterium]
MLHVHRAWRADVLVDALARLLAEPLSDAFAPEVVAVPTRGMERWLAQRMSAVLGAREGRRDGVCANVLFPTPHRLVTDALAAASGIEPAQDPWLPERMVWPLLDVVQGCLDEPWLAPLAEYLRAEADPPDPARPSRRLAAVSRLAVLYHRYALHRPELIDAWREGRCCDDAGAQLAPDRAWQALLWQRLRARIDAPDLAQRAQHACDRLVREPELLALPGRLALFGLTRLPAGELSILRALAVARDLHLFVLHPSPALWGRVQTAIAAARPHGAGPPARSADPTVELPANRLLASWGRDARELQLVLGADGGGRADQLHEPAVDRPRSLLALLQADVRADRSPPGTPSTGRQDTRPILTRDDRSVEVHSCHGRARQVEVIRDAILDAFATDSTLEPRDVIVMCPDVETFAPLIGAVFGAGEQGDEDDRGAVDLRVRLADRSLRRTNPILDLVARLLELADGRLTASDVIDLVDRAPVRRRFGLDDDALERLERWISQAGIRWGLDAPRRAPFRLDTLHSGTWRAGIDRLMLGVAMTEDDQRLFADVLPLDDVDSRSIELAGRFAELVARIGDAVVSLSAAQPLERWARAIGEAADALATTAGPDAWQRAELARLLDDLLAEASAEATAPPDSPAGSPPDRASGSPPDLAPAEIRALLAGRLAGRPTRANFRTGHLTVCTLEPMRSVPHRVVCLLGLDDGAFPRRAPRDGDDLLLADPRVGERDGRSEDRQLLLDALLAATERLIVAYTGNDERTNAIRPPAVPVGELLDAIDATVRLPEGATRDRVVIRHPLQPFDPRNFTPGQIAGAGPWSFDRAALAGARALRGARDLPPPFISGPLPARPAAIVELEELVRFLQHPVRAFLRRRLGVSLWDDDEELDDQLTVALDPLERWGVGQRLLEARMRGIDERQAILAEIARGTLPPGALGRPVIDDVAPIATAIVRTTERIASRGRAADPVDVRVVLADGRLLTGTVAGLAGDALVEATFSRVSPRHRLAAWARVVALSAAWPQRPFSAATVGRASGEDDVRVAQIAALGDDERERHAIAIEQLQLLVDLCDRGMREPLGLPCLTAAAYATAVRDGQDAAAAAAGEWESDWARDREDRDPAHRLAFGRVLSFAQLAAIEPRPGEDGDGWEPDEPTRLGRLARRLWDPLLAREQVRSR